MKSNLFSCRALSLALFTIVISRNIFEHEPFFFFLRKKVPLGRTKNRIAILSIFLSRGIICRIRGSVDHVVKILVVIHSMCWYDSCLHWGLFLGWFRRKRRLFGELKCHVEFCFSPSFFPHVWKYFLWVKIS